MDRLSLWRMNFTLAAWWKSPTLGCQVLKAYLMLFIGAWRLEIFSKQWKDYVHDQGLLNSFAHGGKSCSSQRRQEVYCIQSWELRQWYVSCLNR
jgi:hypothetical protein